MYCQRAATTAAVTSSSINVKPLSFYSLRLLIPLSPNQLSWYSSRSVWWTRLTRVACLCVQRYNIHNQAEDSTLISCKQFHKKALPDDATDWKDTQHLPRSSSYQKGETDDQATQDFRWLTNQIEDTLAAVSNTCKWYTPSSHSNVDPTHVRSLLLHYNEQLPCGVIVATLRLYSKAKYKDVELVKQLLENREEPLQRRSLKDNLFILEALSNLEMLELSIVPNMISTVTIKLDRLVRQWKRKEGVDSWRERMRERDFLGYILYLGGLSCTRLVRCLHSTKEYTETLEATKHMITALKGLFITTLTDITPYYASAMVLALSQVNGLEMTDIVELTEYYKSLTIDEIDSLESLRLLFKGIREFLFQTRSMDTTYKGDVSDEIEVVSTAVLDEDSKRIVEFLKSTMQVTSWYLMQNRKQESAVLIDLFSSYSFVLLYFPKLMEHDRMCIHFFHQLSQLALSRGNQLNAQLIARLFSIFSQRRSMKFRSSISKLVPLVMPRLHQFETRHISMIYNACATVNIREVPLMKAFEERFEENLCLVWSAQSISNILRSVSKLDFYCDPLLNSMIKTYIPQKLDEFTVHGLINISFSLAVFDKAYDASVMNNLWDTIISQIIKKNQKISLEGLFQLKLITYLLYGPNTNGTRRISSQPLIRRPASMHPVVSEYLTKIWELPMKLVSPQPSTLQNEILFLLKDKGLPILSEIIVGPYIIDILAL